MADAISLKYSGKLEGCFIKNSDVELIINSINNYYEKIRKHTDENIFINYFFLVNYNGQEAKAYRDIVEFKNNNEISILSVETIELEVSISSLARFNISMEKNGSIALDLSGHYEEFIFCRNEILNILNNSQKETSVLAKLLNNTIFYDGLNILIVVIMLILLLRGSFAFIDYLKAKEIGVNVSESIIPKNNEIYVMLEEAIYSNDINLKLNLLLQLGLRGFVNSDKYMNDRIVIIKNSGVLFFSMIFLLLFINKLKKTYEINITIGYNEKQYMQLEKKRGFWVFTVLLTIALNIISHIIITFF
jgi:hypothetical protein